MTSVTLVDVMLNYKIAISKLQTQRYNAIGHKCNLRIVIRYFVIYQY